MKRIIISTLLLSVILGCRKETPRELPKGTKVSEFTCYNNIQDEGEDGIDCGVNCEPCNLSLANCTLVDNQFTESYTTSTSINFSPSNITAVNTSGALVIEATEGTKYVRITFSNANPIVFSSYTVKQYGVLADNEVKIEYRNASGYIYQGYTSEIHLNRINGKYEVEFCDVYLNTSSLGGYINGKGKLTQG